MERNQHKIVKSLERVCEAVQSLFWCFLIVYLILSLACRGNGTFLGISTTVLDVLLGVAVWTFILSVFAREVAVFYEAVKERDSDWTKVSLIRFVIMMLLVAAMCWGSVGICNNSLQFIASRLTL